MGGWVRYWSVEERHEVFQQYFDGSAMNCPVCAQTVAYRMNHTRELVTLEAYCENCGNRAVLFFNGLIGLPVQKLEHKF